MYSKNVRSNSSSRTSPSESRKTIQFDEYPKTVETEDTDESNSSTEKAIKTSSKKATLKDTKPDTTQNKNQGSSREQVNDPKEYPFVIEIPEQEEKKKKKGNVSAKSKEKFCEHKKK